MELTEVFGLIGSGAGGAVAGGVPANETGVPATETGVPGTITGVPGSNVVAVVKEITSV